MVLYARIANMILSVAMVIIAVLSYVGADVATGVLASYVIIFGCLLCCFETHLKQVARTIAENFGFLFHAKSRAIFLILFVYVFMCLCAYVYIYMITYVLYGILVLGSCC